MSVDLPILPKKKQIRLPFQPSYLPKSANKSQPRCAICTKQQSKYFCPRCNIPYCSLECYQNTSKHSQCSEPFYRQEIELEMKAERGEKGDNEVQQAKGKMWEMLKRFEEGIGEDTLDGLDDEFGPESEGENRDGEGDGLDELQALLEGAQLDNLSPEELLSLLPPSLRSEFIASISSDPSQPSAVIQTLLESEELSADAEAPWWMPIEEGRVDRVEEKLDEDVGFLEGVTAMDKKTKRQAAPAVLEGPTVQPTEAAAENLAYNILAVALAYIQLSLVYRISPWTLPSISPKSNQLDRKETSHQACRELMSFVPFLGEAGSTLLLKSVEEVEVFLQSLTHNTTPIPSSIIKAHVLPLLVPAPTIAMIPDSNSAVDPSTFSVQQTHPLQRLLADIHRTLSQTSFLLPTSKSALPPSNKSNSAKSISSTQKRAIKKLEFLIGCVNVIPRATWTRLGNEVETFYSKKEREEAQKEEEMEDASNVWSIGQWEHFENSEMKAGSETGGVIESIGSNGVAQIETLDDDFEENTINLVDARRANRTSFGRIVEIG